MIPWAPPTPRDSGAGDRISALLRDRGRAEADAAARSGQIWGNAIQSIGQQVTGAIKDHRQQKVADAKKASEEQLAKQDAAFMARISDQSKPPITPNETLAIYGPQRGPAIFKGYAALQSDAPDLKTVLSGFDASHPAMRAKAWPSARQKLLATGQIPETVPEEYDHDWYEKAAPSWRGKGEGPKTREVKVRNPDGSETIQIVEDKPGFSATSAAPEPKMHKVTVPGPGGRPIDKLVTEDELKAGVGTYQEPKAPKDDRLVQIQGPDGTAIWVPEAEAKGKPAAQAARGVTGQERTHLGFYNRARKAFEDSDLVADKIGRGFVDEQRTAYEGPGSNYLKSEEQQAYRQAQRAFTEARLRKESGAAIPDHELTADAKTYFAQPGDTPAVLAQKKAAREEVLRGMAYGAGKAYDEYYGEPAPTPRNQAGNPKEEQIDAAPWERPKPTTRANPYRRK